MTDPLLAPLANWIAAYHYDAGDESLRQRLWMTMLDWSSALVAGTGHPLFEPYKAGLLGAGETGQASVIATDGRFPVSAAAQVNAAVSHLWEVDDAHRDSTTHPGITVIPTVMALAEEFDLDAQTAASAIIAGYETILRIGSYFGAQHYRVNHSTATAGTMGAAAAAARALKLDAQKTLFALGHAGTQAAGLWAFLDDKADDAKAFHAAIAVRNGIAASKLTQVGISAATHIIEAPRGIRAAWHLDGLDDRWLVPNGDLMIHTVTIKGWPVCGQMHSLLDAATDLQRQYPDIAASTSPVTVRLPQSAIAIAGRDAPQTVAEAKFSTSFCVAAVLCGKPPSFRGLTDDLLADDQVRDRARQISLVETPEFTARFPAERPARISIDAQGTSLSEERSFRKGDPEAPWTSDEILQRTDDVLALTDLRLVDTDRLSAWSMKLAECNPNWRAKTMFATN